MTASAGVDALVAGDAAAFEQLCAMLMSSENEQRSQVGPRTLPCIICACRNRFSPKVHQRNGGGGNAGGGGWGPGPKPAGCDASSCRAQNPRSPLHHALLDV
jgi:hypothetical protein